MALNPVQILAFAGMTSGIFHFLLQQNLLSFVFTMELQMKLHVKLQIIIQITVNVLHNVLFLVFLRHLKNLKNV